MTGLEWAELSNLILIGLLAGNDVAVWAVVHPALDSIPVTQSFGAERAMLLRYKTIIPLLILLILVSGSVVAALDDLWSTRFWLAVSGTVAIFLWQLIVLSLYPLNVKVMEAPADEVPDPEEWRRMRRKWYQRHTVRTVLSVGGLAVFILSALRI
ncbi:MAG TPA: DUF1772 domain-containing protein [Gaiellaceae bacterium]